jgi:hypothetical protein
MCRNQRERLQLLNEVCLNQLAIGII